MCKEKEITVYTSKEVWIAAGFAFACGLAMAEIIHVLMGIH